MLAQFVVAIKGLALSIFIARNLGAVVFGKYSFAFTAIFAVFSDLGYNTLRIREVARAKSVAGKYLKRLHDIWNSSGFHRASFRSNIFKYAHNLVLLQRR